MAIFPSYASGVSTSSTVVEGDSIRQTTSTNFTSENIDNNNFLTAHQEDNDDLGTLFNISASGTRDQLLAFLRQIETIDQDSKDYDRHLGRTPLMHAVHNGNTDIALCFIEELHANLEKTDQYGDPILLIALRKRNSQITRSLLQVGGIDPNTQWNIITGETPLEIAEKYLLENSTDEQAKELMELLIRYGTDFDIESDEEDMIEGGNSEDSRRENKKEIMINKYCTSHVRREHMVTTTQDKEGEKDEDLLASSSYYCQEQDENSETKKLFIENIENEKLNTMKVKSLPSKNPSPASKLFGQVKSQTNNEENMNNATSVGILEFSSERKLSPTTTLNVEEKSQDQKERQEGKETNFIKSPRKRQSRKSPRSSLRSSLLNSIFDDNTCLDTNTNPNSDGLLKKKTSLQSSEPPPNGIPVFARQRSHNLRNSLNEPGSEYASYSTEGDYLESNYRSVGYISTNEPKQRSSLPCPSIAPFMTSGNSTSSDPLSTIIRNDGRNKVSRKEECKSNNKLNEEPEQREKQNGVSLDEILQDEIPTKISFPSDRTSLESYIDDSSSQVSLLASRDSSNRSLFKENTINSSSDVITKTRRNEGFNLDTEIIPQLPIKSQSQNVSGKSDLLTSDSIVIESESPPRESFSKELNSLLNMWSFAPLEDNPIPTPFSKPLNINLDYLQNNDP